MRWCILLATFAFGGCGYSGSPGALGQASFGADCGPSDASCLVSGMSAPLAVGATLPVDINLHIMGGATPATTLVSVNPEIVEASGNDLIGVNEGVVAILVTFPEGEVLDFIHVWVQEPTELAFRRLTEDGLDLGEVGPSVQLLVDQEIILSVDILADFQSLLGNMEVDWSVDSEAVTILDDGVSGRRRLVARAAGTATITASAPDLSVSLDIEVLP